jgi:8-oxo-dGTP pyrophosphatase MutT (NUDIX family)
VPDYSEPEIQECLRLALEGDTGDPYLEYPPLLQFAREKSRPAAVLIPLLRVAGAWHILYTRRREDLPEHSGQVAFPGGRADPGDCTSEDTALREACEEIGLLPEDVRILGRLKKYHTITNYLITPIIGVIPWPYPLKLETQEVSRAFTIPLDWLMDPVNHEERLRSLPAPSQPVNVIYFKLYDGELLWGASARLTLAFINALKCADK